MDVRAYRASRWGPLDPAVVSHAWQFHQIWHRGLSLAYRGSSDYCFHHRDVAGNVRPRSDYRRDLLERNFLSMQGYAQPRHTINTMKSKYHIWGIINNATEQLLLMFLAWAGLTWWMLLMPEAMSVLPCYRDFTPHPLRSLLMRIDLHPYPPAGSPFPFSYWGVAK